MRIIIFIVFIMMIIIFVNELKNVSMSFLNINYLKDVADINIKKHCNDIYCEAETGRFNIANNSYKLLLPNDIFNTKTYYFMILLIIIIFYINIFYKFIKYNNLYYPYIVDFDGTIIINFIKNLPYIFAFIVLLIIIVILIVRYAPTEAAGYRNYFNTDNIKVSEIHFLNINEINNNVNKMLFIIVALYWICTSTSVSSLYEYPPEKKDTAIINKNLSFGYLIITILLTYLILNIMNILLSFTENNYPKLDNNNFYNIILKKYNEVLYKTERDTKNFSKERLLFSCYTEYLDLNQISTTARTDIGKDIVYYEEKEGKILIKYGITVDNAFINESETETYYQTYIRSKNVHVVLYDNIDYDLKKDNAKDIEIKLLLKNEYFTFVSPLIPYKKLSCENFFPRNGQTLLRYYDKHIKKYNSYKDIIYNLDIQTDPINEENIKTQVKYKKLLDKYDYYDPFYMIDNIRIGHFKQEIYNKIFVIFDNIITNINNTDGKQQFTDDDKVKLSALNINLGVIGAVVGAVVTVGNPMGTGAISALGAAVDSKIDEGLINKDSYLKGLLIKNDKHIQYQRKQQEMENRVNVITEKYNVLLNLLIYFSLNEIKYWKDYKSKDIYNDDNYYPDYNYIETKIIPDYEKHKILLDLIKYFKEQKINRKKTIDNALKNDSLVSIKTNLISEIEKYTKYDDKKDKDEKDKKKPFFGKEYNVLNNLNEIKENFSVDLSYNSENTFYEKYFNISNNDKNIYDIEYKIGYYFIKNIKNLIYYIILIIIVSIVLIILFYRNIQSSLTTFSYDVILPLIILLIFTFYITIFMTFNTNYNLNVIFGLFDSSYKRDLNDMNNLIIPFIKLHDNNQKKYDNDYYDLYIITNVLASFLYANDSNPDTNIYLDMTTERKYSKEEARDYNDFRKYYNEQFIKINKEFEKDWDKSNSLAKLYDFINEEIIEISKGSTYDKENFIKKFTDYGTNKIINVIKICLELFGNNKDAYKNNELISKYVYFEKDKNGEIIPHKFRLKISIFKELEGVVSNGYYEARGQKIRVFNDDEKEKNINNIIKNYMTIISYLHFNTLLFAPFKKMVETSSTTNFRPSSDGIAAHNPRYTITPETKFTYKSMIQKTYYHEYKILPTTPLNFNPDRDIKCDILVVGGGGGGGGGNKGGGGGGGGVIFKKNIEIKSIAGGHSITIGAAGTTNEGGDTTFYDYTAKGGKKGKEGEGGSSGDILYKGAKISDGNSGGNGFKTIAAPTTFTKGGGGGGAGGKGVDGTETKAGNGGIGIDARSSIPSYYGDSGHFGGGGGGGNGTDTANGLEGTGGTGGGGSEDVNGEQNRGGGGGARNKAGGSGVVIIKYVLYEDNLKYYVIDEKETNYFDNRQPIYNNIDNLTSANLTPEHLHDHLHKYKNKRLLSLISNTKKFDKDNFKLASGTFDKNSRETDDIKYLYTNIIETYNVNVPNITENYLENIINTICYQIDNRDVIMNKYSREGHKYSIKDKNSDAHQNSLNILHKANQCISFDFATNYTINLIMLGIIYYIGLYNNKIF